ncbi:MAG TPA: 3-keto-5-aminohexanoate cleavage protein [Candidatus Blautia faecipullorum]|nr:3-keto-5-aminohexanoate cleavage protein [Candidatus Blautia faecipullorum]
MGECHTRLIAAAISMGGHVRVGLEDTTVDACGKSVSNPEQVRWVAELARLMGREPASRSIYKEAMEKGYVSTLIEAGAIMLQTGCTLCAGTNYGIVSDNQVVLGTNNRNFLGRMGSAGSEIYLCSPAVAAVSAIYGKITDPRKYQH